MSPLRKLPMRSSGEGTSESFWGKNQYETTPKPYTSLEEIVAYSTKTPPWWKKALSGPSAEFETNFIFSDCSLGAILMNSLPRKASAVSCFWRRFRMLFKYVSIKLRRYECRRQIDM